MALTMCFVSSAFVVTKTVEAAINWTSLTIQEYAHTYRGGSVAWGDNLGLFELIGILLFSTWSLALTFTSLYGAGELWKAIDLRAVTVKTEGQGGVALDEMEALKLFTLCMIVGLTALIGGFSLGDTANELITWFDEYADDTKSEGDEKTDPSNKDPNGTAAKYDIMYHYITLAMGHMLFTMITFGGHMFGMHFMRFNDEVDCDFNMIDDATISEVRGIFTTVTSLEKCYEVMPTILSKMDVNHNKWLDRCEDANILHHLFGNDETYSRKYSHFMPTAAAYDRCDQLFNPLF